MQMQAATFPRVGAGIAAMTLTSTHTERYARCIEASRRVRWEIERDVIRGRELDFSRPFLPDGLSRVTRLVFLDADEQCFLSQIQGRTYANMLALMERFIGIQMLAISREHWYGDQVALEAVVRFADEELKHQALFRMLEAQAAARMTGGYEFCARPNAVAAQVLQASSWAVLALTCHIELFTQVHYRASIARDEALCALFKDVFLFHWKEESQHAVLDELEWLREDARLTRSEREQAVTDLIGLLGTLDALLQQQAQADTLYFQRSRVRTLTPAQAEQLGAGLLNAYRWQYIVSGLQDLRFGQILGGLLSSEQGRRIQSALQPLMAA